MPKVSDKTIGRLSLYRRLLNRLVAEGKSSIFSHELATLSGGSSAQVRRDLMSIGYSGTPVHGYQIEELTNSIANILDDPQGQRVALIGLGNLGKAILAFFSGRRPNLSITAAFDIDPAKVNRVIHGCRCYPMESLISTIRAENISVGIIAVPARDAVQIAEQLVLSGIRSILNFAPVRLHLPDDVHEEVLDVTTALEKAAYFARLNKPE